MNIFDFQDFFRKKLNFFDFQIMMKITMGTEGLHQIDSAIDFEGLPPLFLDWISNGIDEFLIIWKVKYLSVNYCISIWIYN